MPVGCVESREKLMAMCSGVMVSSGHSCDSGGGGSAPQVGVIAPKMGLVPHACGQVVQGAHSGDDLPFLQICCDFRNPTLCRGRNGVLQYVSDL